MRSTRRGRGRLKPELPFSVILGGLGCGIAFAVTVITLLATILRSRWDPGASSWWPTLGMLSLGFGVTFGSVFLRGRPWLYTISFGSMWLILPVLVLLTEAYFYEWVLPYIYGPSLLGVPMLRVSVTRWLWPHEAL